MKTWIVPVALLVAVFWWTRDETIVVADGNVELTYVVEYSGDAGRRDALPMLVALHGNGDEPDHFYETALDQVSTPARVLLFEGPFSYGGGHAWPSDETGMKEYGAALSEAVNQLAEEYPTLGDPVLMGFSGGGMMAYQQAAAHGDTYSTILPVSGWLNAGLMPAGQASTRVAVHAFHGKSDGVISIAGGRKAIALLAKQNPNVQLAEFDEGHLGVFRSMKPEISSVLNEALASAR